MCPLHEDHDPSLSLTVKPADHGTMWGLFGRCTAGSCRASLPDVIRHFGLPLGRVLYGGNDAYASEVHRTSAAPLPDLAELCGWTEALWADDARLRYLRDERGLSERVVRKYRIGWNEAQGRYMLPVADLDGKLANVRRYRPDAKPGEGKMVGLRGRGGQLYPLAPTPSDADPVLVAEGEWDALVARSHGLTAVCGTLGAATWRPAWSAALAGRSVAFVYDCDKAGRDGAAEAAAVVGRVAKFVRVVDLGLQPGEDLTDWFIKYERSRSDLLGLIAGTPSLGGVGGGGRRG